VLKYINWDESKGWHKGATCAARVTADRAWYDLTGHEPSPALWPKERQYRHIAPANPNRLIANCRLYEIYPPVQISDPDIWGGILNSSWSLLSSLQYGRPVGNEGNWSTMVVDANLMLVPNPINTAIKLCEQVASAFRMLAKRPAMQFLAERRMREMAFAKAGRKTELESLSNLSELDMPDRRDLDEAVLEMLGVKDRRDRSNLIERLYAYLREFFEQVRQKEEKAIVNKNTSKRKSASPSELAGQVLAELKDKYGYLLRPYSDFVDVSKPFSTYDLPTDGAAELHHDLFADQGSVRFTKGRKPLAMITTKAPAQAALIVLIAEHGVRGLVRIPLKSEDCQTLHKTYARLIEDRAQRIRNIVDERTGDPDLQEEIFETVDSFIAHPY
jgi:hypothetical protein